MTIVEASANPTTEGVRNIRPQGEYARHGNEISVRPVPGAGSENAESVTPQGHAPDTNFIPRFRPLDDGESEMRESVN